MIVALGLGFENLAALATLIVAPLMMGFLCMAPVGFASFVMLMIDYNDINSAPGGQEFFMYYWIATGVGYVTQLARPKPQQF